MTFVLMIVDLDANAVLFPSLNQRTHENDGSRQSHLLSASSLDLNGYGTGYDLYGGYYPSFSLYDPTDTIQDVIGYRQSVMDWSNDAWDAYIRQ